MRAESIREKNDDKPQWEVYRTSKVKETGENEDDGDISVIEVMTVTTEKPESTVGMWKSNGNNEGCYVPRCDSFSRSTGTDFILDTFSDLSMQN